MNESLLIIGVTLLALFITYLFFSFRCMKYYAKTMLSKPDPNDVICLVVKNDEVIPVVVKGKGVGKK